MNKQTLSGKNRFPPLDTKRNDDLQVLLFAFFSLFIILLFTLFSILVSFLLRSARCVCAPAPHMLAPVSFSGLIFDGRPFFVSAAASDAREMIAIKIRIRLSRFYDS